MDCTITKVAQTTHHHCDVRYGTSRGIQVHECLLYQLLGSSGMWNRFDLDCILGKGDQLSHFIGKLDLARVQDPDNDKNSIKIEWVIQKTSLNQNRPKGTHLNKSIVQPFHHSKNEFLASQKYTSKSTLEHRPKHKR